MDQFDLKGTFNTINDAITIHDNNYNILYANKASEELLNLPLKKILSQKCYKSYHNTESPPNYCPCCKSLKTGKPTTTEIFEPHLKKYIDVRTLPRLDDKKKLIGLTHIVRDCTRRWKTEKKISNMHEELKQFAVDLEESHIALKVLMKQRVKDKKELEESVLSNVNKLIVPYLTELKKRCPSSKEFDCLNIIEANLGEIISPFSRKLDSDRFCFTACEVRIADLIAAGLHDKDIADTLTISVDTVKSHRKHIRKKLGINNKKVTLRTSLLNLKR